VKAHFKQTTSKVAVILEQYDLIYVPQKVIKGQAVADFLADYL